MYAYVCMYIFVSIWRMVWPIKIIYYIATQFPKPSNLSHTILAQPQANAISMHTDEHTHTRTHIQAITISKTTKKSNLCLIGAPSSINQYERNILQEYSLSGV